MSSFFFFSSTQSTQISAKPHITKCLVLFTSRLRTHLLFSWLLAFGVFFFIIISFLVKGKKYPFELVEAA